MVGEHASHRRGRALDILGRDQESRFPVMHRVGDPAAACADHRQAVSAGLEEDKPESLKREWLLLREKDEGRA
jgi:hypothetical protein